MGIVARVLACALLLTVLVSGAPAEAATRPSPPRAVKAVPADRAVTISWAAPSSTGGARIDRYAVQRWVPARKRWTTVTYTTGSARSWRHTGLTNGRTYYFQVLAHNRRGWSRGSADVAAAPRTVPSAPRFPEADTHDSALGLYWQPPASSGGATISGYRTEISTDGATWTRGRTVAAPPTSETPVLYAGLTPGVRYWLRVRARNAAGYGPGAGAGPYRAYTVPNPVGDLNADVGDGSVQLSWTAPVVATAQGRPAATGYLVEQSSDGITWSPLAPEEGAEDGTTTTATALTVTGLVNGTTHHFRVSARSAIERIGFGVPTEVVTDPPVGTPGAPQNPTLEWDDDDGFTLAWSAPASTGGAPLDRYEVERDGITEPVAAATTSLTGVAGDEQTFRVRACNTLDFCGAWTDVLGPLPGRPTDAAAQVSTVAGLPRVELAWTAPTGGGAVAAYTVLRRVGSDPFVAIGSTPDAAFVDLDVEADTTYDYRVVATGPAGSGRPVEVAGVATGPVQELGP